MSEKLIESVYKTISTGASYTSPKKIAHAIFSKHNKRVSTKEIRAWLDKQRVYNLHQYYTKKFKRIPTIAMKVNEQWQADLMFLPEMKKQNGKIWTALLIIDVLTRFARGAVLKRKTGPEVSKAMEKIIKESTSPEKLHTDEGSEFFNSDFGELMNRYNIDHFYTHSDHKAAIVERLIKTIKEKIYRTLEDQPKLKNRWIDIFPEILNSYNNTFHESIQMTPQEAQNIDKEPELLDILLKKYWEKDRNEKRQTTLKENDVVRLSRARQVFDKGYRGNWTEEMFIVDKVKNTLPETVYTLKDLKNEPIIGIFYKEELQKQPIAKEAIFDDTVFPIEKILRTRQRGNKKEYLIRWTGYSSEHDSWEPEKNIVHFLEDQPAEKSV